MNIKLFTKNHRGFTLIELLVVIAIISLLSSVVFASLNTARAKTRDARRLSDLKQINNAIIFYYDKYGFYPQCGSNNVINGSDCLTNTLTSEKFMSQVPSDPRHPTNYYQYYTDTNGTMYALRGIWFEGSPLPRTGSYPNGTTCQSAQYPRCGWYSSCVYVGGGSCNVFAQAYGSQ